MKNIAKICAVYTRKSTDERLDVEFNTLDAQREACEAYICSQRSEGWALSPLHYDDGGFSGGSLKRPALERLIQDIKAGKVNIVVVYKIDRLTRSLSDFAKLVDVFDAHGVTFVSVTQSFNTTTSMGRLTLNVLLSFAQFEREVTGERIRDKIAASKAKGMWQGGRAPFGYDIGDRRLVVNDADAKAVRQIFELYLKLAGVSALEFELQRRGIKSRERVSQKGSRYGGNYFSRGALHALLVNPVYLGKIMHKGQVHEGLHDAIIPQELWDKVQEKLQRKAPCERGEAKHKQRNLLTKVIFDEYGRPYTPSFTTRKGQQYRYYYNLAFARNKQHPDYMRARFPAHEIENVVEQALSRHVGEFLSKPDDIILTHIQKHCATIPTDEWLRACKAKVVVHYNHVVIACHPLGLQELLEKYLNVSVTCMEQEIELSVPYQSRRGRDGAKIIQSGERDILDLSPEDLKKLVQGIAWRDEHFAGTYIKDIAARENCSDRYVRNRIMASFEFPDRA